MGNSLILAVFLAVATALPIDDTPEVAAAKAEFSAAFTAAEKGEHADLAPVNTDIQAAAPAAALPAFSYGVTALHAAYPYNLGLPAGLPYNGLTAAGLPYAALPAAGLPYTGLPYTGHPLA